MKKKLAVILAVVMLFTLCACGSEKREIKNALQGEWYAEWFVPVFDISVRESIVFTGDNYTFHAENSATVNRTETGTYKIKDNYIWFSNDPDDDSHLYSYNSKTGELTLMRSFGELYDTQIFYKLR